MLAPARIYAFLLYRPFCLFINFIRRSAEKRTNKITNGFVDECAGYSRCIFVSRFTWVARKKSRVSSAFGKSNHTTLLYRNSTEHILIYTFMVTRWFRDRMNFLCLDCGFGVFSWPTALWRVAFSSLTQRTLERHTFDSHDLVFVECTQH